jgi:hypothetical protein
VAVTATPAQAATVLEQCHVMTEARLLPGLAPVPHLLGQESGQTVQELLLGKEVKGHPGLGLRQAPRQAEDGP